MCVVAAIAGAGVVGSIGGAVISSNAVGDAADASLQAAQQNNALQQSIYSSNTANLSPYLQRGNTAAEYYNALLGIPGAPANNNTTPSGSGGYYFAGTDANGMPIIQPYAAQPAASTTPSIDATGAFNTFKNSDGYQFRLNQGLNALNQNYAAKGLIQSGAAMKGINNYAQNQASGEFGNYLNNLASVSDNGLRAGSAIAGVGQGYANAVSANNNSAASAAGNAALAGANGINNAIGNGLNSLGQYAYSSFNSPFSYAGVGTPTFGSGPQGNGAYGIAGSDGIY